LKNKAEAKAEAKKAASKAEAKVAPAENKESAEADE
jgi:hypothetical protein